MMGRRVDAPSRRPPSLSIGLGIVLLVLPSRTGLAAQECLAETGDHDAVEAVATGIVEADNQRLLGDVLSFYAPDAVLHPPNEPPVRGLAAIRPRYEALFETADPAILTTIESTQVCGDLAVVAGHNGGLLRGRGGAPDRALSDTFVMVLRRSNGVWQISRLIWHPDRN